MFPRRFPDTYSDEEFFFFFFLRQPRVFKLTFICVPYYTIHDIEKDKKSVEALLKR